MPDHPVSIRTLLRVITVVACLAGAFSVARAAEAATPAESLGTFRGAANVRAIAEYEAWRGRPVHRVLDFLADDDWRRISQPYWWVDAWSASAYRDRLVYSVPMLPRTGGSLAAGARGDYDAHFRRLAELLVRRRQSGVTLRLGWEFNGSWYRWSVRNAAGAEDYAAYWRRIVRAMRAVPGAAFRFDWCTNNGSEPWNVDVEAAYPGDDFVDYVSQDVYDQAKPAIADPARRWWLIYWKTHGLDWAVKFAARHRKRFAVGEWGLGYNRWGGGDNPDFIARMHAFMARTNPTHHFQWEYTDGPRLMTGRNPSAAEAFLRLFG